MQNRIIVLWGASGTGKSSLADYLVAHEGYTKIKTVTTRPKRTKDENDYHFVSVPHYKQMQTFAGTYFDGNYYGSSLTNVCFNLHKRHKLVIILTWSGVTEYVAKFKGMATQVYPIEVFAPYKAILSRLNHRSDNNVTEKDLQERFASYQKQAVIADSSDINSYIVNSYAPLTKAQNLKNEVAQLDRIVK